MFSSVFTARSQADFKELLSYVLIFLHLFVPVRSAESGTGDICRKVTVAAAQTAKGIAWVFTRPVDHEGPPRYSWPRYFPWTVGGETPDRTLRAWLTGPYRFGASTLVQAWRIFLDTVDGAWLTRAITFGRREPRWFTALAFALFMGFPAMHKGWDTLEYWKIEKQVEAQPALYDERMETDPRFSFIEDARDAGVMTPGQARMATYRLLEGKFGIKAYYKDIRPRLKLHQSQDPVTGEQVTSFHPPLTDELRGRLLESALFQEPALQTLMQHGVHPGEGFDVVPGREGALSIEQVDQLILNRVQLFDTLLRLDESFRNSPEYRRIASLPAVQATVSSALNDEFIAGIRQRHEELIAKGEKGLYTEREYHRFVLENELWKSIYGAWNTLGIRPKVELGDFDDDGKHTLGDMQIRRAVHLRDRR